MVIPSRAQRFLISVHRRASVWGFDGRQTIAAIRGSATVARERKAFDRQRSASDHPNEFPVGPGYVIYQDRYSDAGVATGHYFHQDLLVAREIHARAPDRHIDVGSAIYGFVSHVAAFRDIEVLDVRPVHSEVPGIHFIQRDVMDLDASWEAVTDSLSCLHALEHFGLGRYGDPIDYEGWRKGLHGLVTMLKPDGVLYLGVPTGEIQRVEFNAHRVFSLPFLRDVLSQDFEIERLSFVCDDGSLTPHLDPFSPDADRSMGASYGCSIWVLRKLSHPRTVVTVGE